jgi:hypothetical protein
MQQAQQQPHQEQQQMQPGERALYVLLGIEPTSTFEQQLLRCFHGVSCSGRAAALGTIRRLRFHRCRADTPVTHQLYVLTAAHRVTAVTLSALQVGPFLHALLAQQQQQDKEEEGGRDGGHQQGLVISSGAVPGSSAGDAAPAAASLTTALAATTLSDSSSSSSRQGATLAAAPDPRGYVLGLPARPAGPPGCARPRLTDLIIKCDYMMGSSGFWTEPTFEQREGTLAGSRVTAATVEQLVQLIDALPGTQHLEYLLLDLDGRLSQLETETDEEVQQVLSGDTWGEGAISAAICPDTTTTTSSSSSKAGEGQRAPVSTAADSSWRISSSSHQAAAGVPTSMLAGSSSSSSSSSWCSSCHTLLVSNEYYKYMSVGELQPLLVALPQLQVLGLQGADMDDLWECVSVLQPLRALLLSDIKGSAGSAALDVLVVVPGLANLRHLCLQNCDPYQQWEVCYIPGCFGTMQHLTSFHLHNMGHTVVQLEGLCGATSLKEIVLWKCPACRHLPAAIGALTGLNHLTVYHTGVTHLPEAVTAITQLTGLVWESLTSLHPDLDLDLVWDLTSLEHLYIGNSGIASPPDDVTCLTALTELIWAHQGVGGTGVSLPDSISALQKLEVLELWGDWMVKPVAAGIRALPHLSCLEVPPVRATAQGYMEAEDEGGDEQEG